MGWQWNMFDLVVVFVQMVDISVQIAVGNLTRDSDAPAWNHVDALDVTFKCVQVLRILRLIRVFRVVRILRVFHELRALVVSILSSLSSLMWALSLLMLVVYMVAVFIVQLVTDHVAENPGL